MLTRFQLDSYLSTQAMLKSWGPNYSTELARVTSIIESEIEAAHTEALAENLERTLTDYDYTFGYIDEAHTEALEWNSKCDALIATIAEHAKVSLVKFTAPNYQAAGHPAGMAGIPRNDLRLLHWAIAGGTL